MGPWDKTTLFNANPFLHEILNYLGETYCPIKHNTTQLDYTQPELRLVKIDLPESTDTPQMDKVYKVGRCQLGGGSLQPAGH